MYTILLALQGGKVAWCLLLMHVCIYDISLVPRLVFEKSDFGSRPGNGALKLWQILLYLLESDSGGSSCLWSGFHCFLIIISIEHG